MDKVFIKRLYELNKAWREQNKNNITVEDLLLSEIDKKDLQKWFDERVSPNYDDVLQTKQAETFFEFKPKDKNNLSYDEKKLLGNASK